MQGFHPNRRIMGRRHGKYEVFHGLTEVAHNHPAPGLHAIYASFRGQRGLGKNAAEKIFATS
jgi:hypothetical protein